MNWHLLLGTVGAGLSAAGAAVPGPLGWIMTGLGAVALYQTNKDKAHVIATAKKIGGAVAAKVTGRAGQQIDDEEPR